MKCYICEHDLNFIFNAKILKKFDVEYYQCVNCGFIRTERPYWLDEAYKDPVSIHDTGMVQRAILWRDAIRRIIYKYFDPKSKYIDYGGGTGLLVRLLRDIGFDYYRYDPYSNNIFARGFDISDLESMESKFEMLTAFEVFEHIENPLDLLKELFEKSDTILFTTLLLPDDKSLINPAKWAYFIPETGQHISFYTKKSLQMIASIFKCNYFTDDEDVHILTFKDLKLSPDIIRDLVLPGRLTAFHEFIRKIRYPDAKIPIYTTNDYDYILNVYSKKNSLKQ